MKIKKHNNTLITVTKPSLPPLEEFIPYLESIWEKKWITNKGEYHEQLEGELAEFLGADHLSLCANGTLALMIALKAMDIRGEVITTPFSFVATAHSILWQNCKPVFCDIDAHSFNIDPDKIEALITDRTSAILPVHVYGNPCDHERIREIADRRGLRLIYDAAHAFHVRQNGKSVCNWGDLSILSFHATKVYHTFEGGAVISHSDEIRQKIEDLRNFGFHGETRVEDLGINAKMNEVQAAMGLLQLRYTERQIAERRKIAAIYDRELRDVSGLQLFVYPENVEPNYSYYPVMVNEKDCACSRDELYLSLKKRGIYTRRYFYPLITHFPMYRTLPSADPNTLPVAEAIAKQVICLPVYPALEEMQVRQICELIRKSMR